MADEFCFALLHTTTLQILSAAGFDAGHSKATHVLTNVFQQYLELLSTTASDFSRLSGRTTGTIYDCIDTLDELAIDLPTLQSWLTEESKALIPCWTEQGDPSRTLKDVVNGGLNRQEDVITYKYTDPTSKSDLVLSDDKEEEEKGSPMDEEISENKENNLPDYVPSYFPPFPVMITPEENEESVIIETKTQLPTLTNDTLPLPNIVKKKSKPIDNPFTFLKPFEESMLATGDADQPEALALSMKVGEVKNQQNSSLLSQISENDNSAITLKRRRSESLTQLIDQIQYHGEEQDSNKRQLTDEIKLFNEATKEGAAPGNTMFSHESGLLDKLMIENAPPIAVPKLMAPNLLMDIVVPPGPATPSSSTTLRLNMSPTNSRKPSLGGITIEESGGSKPSTAAPTPTDLLSTDVSPTTIKISPISLAALSSPSEEKKSKEKPVKEKKEKIPKEKKPKATKSKKKLTISFPKPQSDSILTNSNSGDQPEEPPTTAEVPDSAAPVIRFTIKPPTEQKPVESPKSANTTDVINCICENPTVDYGAFMVACDTCGVWFHGQCVGIAESDHIDEWHCKRCVTKE